MGIFSSQVWGRRSLKAEEWMLAPLTKAGVRISEETALTISAVWQCVLILAQNIGTLPEPIYRWSNGGKHKAYSHRLWKLLNLKANPWMTAATFRMAIMVHLALWQVAYVHIERDGYGVKALWPLLPDRTKPVTIGDQLYFRTVLHDGTVRTLPADEVLYIPGLTLNGLEAMSMVRKAREVLGLLLGMQEFGSRFFGSGANPGGIVTTEDKLTPEQKRQIAQDIADQVGGLKKAHDILVLSNGAKFSPIGVDPQKSQLIESRRFQIEEVARWFNMPPYKLGLMDKGGASYASVEQQQISFVTETLRPWLVIIEQAENAALLTESEVDQYVIEHTVEGLLRGDSKSRMEFYKGMFMTGAYSINDILKLENRNPIGKAGDMHFVPLNMIPVEQAATITPQARALLMAAAEKRAAPKETTELLHALEQLTGPCTDDQGGDGEDGGTDDQED